MSDSPSPQQSNTLRRELPFHLLILVILTAACEQAASTPTSTPTPVDRNTLPRLTPPTFFLV
ncbi:MAG: hypothetical protein MUO30_04815 [Anaerolineales bacterium]|nr:hypothetical protein [Anaerolineales bacterium]